MSISLLRTPARSLDTAIMAVAMASTTAMPMQDDTMDLDIDMEVDDNGPIAEEDMLEV